jgi:2-polyprenyl-6-methoxyphenol hydroxylase-like FAD-dependent oxidoreductase
VIAGGGPTGLMLAGELALGGVDVAIVERRDAQVVDGSRAGGLNARSLEVLDQRGIVERFVAEGQVHRVATFTIPLDLRDCPSRHNYMLALKQERIEQLLADWVLRELAVPIYRARDVAGFAQDDRGVDVALAGGGAMRAEYLVGCDGGRSAVRKAAAIDFAGWDASTSYLIAEADVADEPAWGFRPDATGVHGIGKLDDGRRMRAVIEQPHARADGDRALTVDDLRAALVSVYGTDFGVRRASWVSRFTDAARQAVSYRSGRVLLAGDAAHVHSPVGGQGLNLGVQDAVNLGWKLARVVRGASPDALLDSYGAERHPVGARVLRMTLAQTALRRSDDRSKALHEVMSEMMTMDEPRRRYAARTSGLDICYELGASDAHPVVGRRMPDLDVVIDGAPQRVYRLLHAARPVLLDFTGGVADPRAIRARYDGAWELPALGTVPAPPAVWIRPDGHVAWAGDGPLPGGLDEAARRGDRRL